MAFQFGQKTVAFWDFGVWMERRTVLFGSHLQGQKCRVTKYLPIMRKNTIIASVFMDHNFFNEVILEGLLSVVEPDEPLLRSHLAP